MVKAFVFSVIMKSLEDGVLKCGQNVWPNVNSNWGLELSETEDDSCPCIERCKTLGLGDM